MDDSETIELFNYGSRKPKVTEVQNTLNSDVVYATRTEKVDVLDNIKFDSQPDIREQFFFDLDINSLLDSVEPAKPKEKLMTITREPFVKGIQINKKYESSNLVPLVKNNKTLEFEKEKFLKNLDFIMDNIFFENDQVTGRPKAENKDIMRCLMIMSYHSMSYRRAESDIKKLFDEGSLTHIPKRSTLNKYANDERTLNFLIKFIQDFSLLFVDNEDTVIFDSTWFSIKMYEGGYLKVHNREAQSMDKCRKIHAGCLKNSKIIAIALTSEGTAHDCPFFETMIRKVVENGLNIKKVICDAGYSSKLNHEVCEELGIKEVYIDFKKNVNGRNPRTSLWKERLSIFKNRPDQWHEEYKYRAIIEGVWSVIKKKNNTFLRSQKIISQDIELLLKIAVYNITIIGKYD